MIRVLIADDEAPARDKLRRWLHEQPDIELVAEALDPGTSAALLVWENSWATRFIDAVRNVNGIVIDHQRIPSDIVEAAMLAAAT